MVFSEKPIGIFDSGLGGLTAVKSIIKKMPNENIIYLGDSARVPYGEKPRETIIKYACQNADFLIKNDVKAILVACNTADSTARRELEKHISVPIIGVIEPAVQKALELTKNNKIGVIATCTTVSSGAYEKSIKEKSSIAEVFCVPAPLLVPLVEQGKIYRGDVELFEALNLYLTPLIDKEIDTLILGCTHYPLFLDIVQDMMPQANIVCSGPTAVESLYSMLDKEKLLNTRDEHGLVKYYVTGDSSHFEKHGGLFLGFSLEGKVSKVTW